MVSKVVSKILGWQSKILSYGGRATIIKHVLQSLPIHILSVVSPPTTTLKQIKSIIANFFWDGWIRKENIIGLHGKISVFLMRKGVLWWECSLMYASLSSSNNGGHSDQRELYGENFLKRSTVKDQIQWAINGTLVNHLSGNTWCTTSMRWSLTSIGKSTLVAVLFDRIIGWGWDLLLNLEILVAGLTTPRWVLLFKWTMGCGFDHKHSPSSTCCSHFSHPFADAEWYS